MSESVGSIWRQWDFHFHTPSSYDYNKETHTNEEIVDVLLENSISGIVVTDHHLIDVERILELQKIAGDDLAVFPGIEFRSNLGGKETVHYIGIFDNKCNLLELWNTLSVKLGITETKVEQTGHENIIVPFELGAEIVHELGGLISVPDGNKSNSFELIKNNKPHKLFQKKQYVTEYIDLYEVKSAKDEQDYKKIVFPSVGVSRLIISGSDNHNISNYERGLKCWIKADLTFQGLKHALQEPNERVYLGELPPNRSLVSQNKTRYIHSLNIHKTNPNDLPDEIWFDSHLRFNHELVAIIGNKGNGKSALADILGLMGDSKHQKHFSFLNSKKFKHSKNDKSQYFRAKITWESGGNSERSLNEIIPIESTESVKYIPQAYLEKVCNDVSNANENSDFLNELKSVVFSHVDKSDRLGKDSLDELIEYKTEQIEKAIEIEIEKLKQLIDKNVRAEKKIHPNYTSSLKSKIAHKKIELETHLRNKPSEVEKPVENDNPEFIIIQERVNEITEFSATLNQNKELLNKNREEYLNQKVISDKILASLDNLSKQINNFKEENATNFYQIGLSIEDVISFKIQADPITQKKGELLQKIANCDSQLSEDSPESITSKLNDSQKELSELKEKLDLPNKKYQEYLSELSDWKERLQEIKGSKDIPLTLEYFENQLKHTWELPSEITKGWQKCMDISGYIYELIMQITNIYRELYSPVNEYVRAHPLAEKFQLSFHTSLEIKNFQDKFLSFLNQSKKGSFSGITEGKSRINELIEENDFNSKDETLSFLKQIKDRLDKDHRKESLDNIYLEDQLKQNSTPNELYEYLFSLSYLRPVYSL